MGFQWNDKYSTGNADIDNQHKQIFAYLDELEERIEKGNATEKWASDFLSALTYYTRSHFCFEEVCMRRGKCAIAAKNKMQHGQLIATLGKVQRRYEIEGLNDHFLDQLRKFLTSWLVNHIMKVDIHYQDCSKNNPSSQAST